MRAEYPNQLDYSGSVLFYYFIPKPPTVFVTVRGAFQRQAGALIARRRCPCGIAWTRQRLGWHQCCQLHTYPPRPRPALRHSSEIGPYASNWLDSRKPAHNYFTCATTLQPAARSLELSPWPKSWQKLNAHIQTSIRPPGNQGPSDCCSTVQSDALPTGL